MEDSGLCYHKMYLITVKALQFLISLPPLTDSKFVKVPPPFYTNLLTTSDPLPFPQRTMG